MVSKGRGTFLKNYFFTFLKNCFFFSVGETVFCMFFCPIFNLGVSVLLAELQVMLDFVLVLSSKTVVPPVLQLNVASLASVQSTVCCAHL